MFPCLMQLKLVSLVCSVYSVNWYCIVIKICEFLETLTQEVVDFKHCPVDWQMHMHAHGEALLRCALHSQICTGMQQKKPVKSLRWKGSECFIQTMSKFTSSVH